MIDKASNRLLGPNKVENKSRDNRLGKANTRKKQISHESSYKSCYLAMDRERFEIVLENIPSAVVVMEKPDGRVTYANAKAIELHGVNPCGLKMDEHAPRLKILSLDGKVCPTEKLYTYRALFHGEAVRNAPIMIERPDSKRFILNVSATPIRDQEGAIYAAVAIFDDMTQQVKAEEALKQSEERYRTLVNTSPDGIIVHKNNQVAYANPAALQLFGATHFADVKDKSIFDFVHPDEKAKIFARVQKATQGETTPLIEERLLRLDGTEVIAEVVASPITYDGERAVQVVLRDVTVRKALEERLHQYTEHLEDLINKKTEQLKAAERLAAIGQIAGMVGHDIRNPLQSITSDLFLLRQDVDSSPDSECKRSVQESLDSIEDQVNYINKIVSDLQDYSKPLKPGLVEVDICKAIPGILSAIKTPRSIQVDVICDKHVPKPRLDPTFLKRILINLATNAVQAMPNGGKLTVKVFRNDNRAFITIEDTGVGMTDATKQKIWTPLFTTKAKGQGFGLPVVKRLVEAQGGTITFESQLGKGTKFTLELPLPSSQV